MISNPLIVAGQKLPELANPGAAADLLTGKQLIDADGNVLTGTMPEATQATPSISVSSSGLITASATQAAGKVAAGTKSATRQLTTQAAKTVTPTTSTQTAVAAGRYTTGAVTVAPGLAITEKTTVAYAVTLPANTTTKIKLSGSLASPGMAMITAYMNTDYSVGWKFCGMTDNSWLYIYNPESIALYAKAGDTAYVLG